MKDTLTSLTRMASIFGYSTKELVVTFLELQRRGEPWGEFSPRAIPHCQKWSSRFLETAHVRLTQEGSPPSATPTLFVSNHVTYLDIPVLLSILPHASFVSKKEVKDYPLFGSLATLVGTMYMDRSSPASRLETTRLIGERIAKDGRSLILFPEGTTRALGTIWKKGALRIAADYGLTVQPVCLAYDPHDEATWDHEPLGAHFKKLLARPSLGVTVTFGEPRLVTDPRVAAADIQNWCQQTLRGQLERWGTLAEVEAFHVENDRIRRHLHSDASEGSEASSRAISV